MSTAQDSPAQVVPSRGLGILTLGASVHYILTRLKSLPQVYTTLNLSYSANAPIQEPVLVLLPDNGLRLRFDGPDQRLRLIEVLDFSKIPLVYRNQEVVKPPGRVDGAPGSGPTFSHIYNRVFGPSYPGEYVPPASNKANGTYVLSYPGVAFSFPLLHSAWSEKGDFVKLMSSQAALPAASMAIYQGESWAEERSTLFTRQPQYPRSTVLAGKNKDSVADEVELVKVHTEGKLELIRRSSPPFWIILSETTPQDLITELGPPDAIYRKSDSRIMIHENTPPDETDAEGVTSPTEQDAENPSVDQPSDNDLADECGETLSEDDESDDGPLTGECFYNYFHHGFDILISSTSSGSPTSEDSQDSDAPQPTAMKILLHGNVPGSYPFNRHRRSRWVLGDDTEYAITSETPYEQIPDKLKNIWPEGSSPEDEPLQKGMVLNRGWGDTPSNSVQLIGSSEGAPGNRSWTNSAPNNAQSLGNTELFGFPGLLFEVLNNGVVSCLTVY